MTVISVSDLSLSFGTTVILDKISFALNENDKLGVIGVNGCGKSSLFKLITGEYEPNDGSVFIAKDKTVAILKQDSAFDLAQDGENGDTVFSHALRSYPELVDAEARLNQLVSLMEQTSGNIRESYAKEYSILHDAFIRQGGLEYRSRIRSTLQKLGFEESMFDLPVSSLSGGQKTRLSLAIRLSGEPDILLLDEPTNHLDIETLGWLESFLISYKKCLLVISHDRFFLDRVTNKTLAVRHHKAKLYPGNYTRSMELRKADREAWEKAYKNQQKEIARQEAYIAQQRQWNRERNIIAAESRQKLLDKMEKIERPDDDPRAVRMAFTASLQSGNDVLTVKNLSMSFPSRTLFHGLNFLVKRQDRFFIIGPNGCGKSTLIKILLSKIAPSGGKAEFGYNVEIGYYDQENQNISPEKTVLAEVWDRYPRMTERDVRSALALFRFIGEDVFKTVDLLSGGERARLTLCKLMLSRMNLLILDEPTNHLDMDSKEALEEALELFDGTAIIVSHDRYLIEKLATRIAEIKPGGPFEGDLLLYDVNHVGAGYTEFQTYKNARIAEKASSSAPIESRTAKSASKEQYLQDKQQIAEARRKKNRLEKVKAEIAALEKRLEEIDEELFGPAASDYARAAELDSEKAEKEEELLALYEEAENLENDV